jgi:hypothetical protein
MPHFHKKATDKESDMTVFDEHNWSSIKKDSQVLDAGEMKGNQNSIEHSLQEDDDDLSSLFSRAGPGYAGGNLRIYEPFVCITSFSIEMLAVNYLVHFCGVVFAICTVSMVLLVGDDV